MVSITFLMRRNTLIFRSTFNGMLMECSFDESLIGRKGAERGTEYSWTRL
jgi:hypothetical protein